MDNDIQIEFAGGVCPYQAWGMAGDLRWYLRARHDMVSISVSGLDSDPVAGEMIDERAEWMVFPWGWYGEDDTLAHVRTQLADYRARRTPGIWDREHDPLCPSVYTFGACECALIATVRQDERAGRTAGGLGVTLEHSATAGTDLAELLAIAAHDPALTDNTSMPAHDSAVDALTWLRDTTWDVYLVRVDGVPAGYIALHDPDLSIGGEAYLDHRETDEYLLPQFRGRRVMSAAWEPLLRAVPPGTKFVAEIWQDNASSIRRYERDGWEKVGEFWWQDGDDADSGGMCNRYTMTVTGSHAPLSCPPAPPNMDARHPKKYAETMLAATNAHTPWCRDLDCWGCQCLHENVANGVCDDCGENYDDDDEAVRVSIGVSAPLLGVLDDPDENEALVRGYAQIEVMEALSPRFLEVGFVGFDPPYGWLGLVAELHQKLLGNPDYRIAQVKEKFGGLRFYADGLTDAEYALIVDAERESLTTCQGCGSRENVEMRDHGWVATLCEDCDQESSRSAATRGYGGGL